MDSGSLRKGTGTGTGSRLFVRGTFVISRFGGGCIPESFSVVSHAGRFSGGLRRFRVLFHGQQRDDDDGGCNDQQDDRDDSDSQGEVLSGFLWRGGDERREGERGKRGEGTLPRERRGTGAAVDTAVKTTLKTAAQTAAETAGVNRILSVLGHGTKHFLSVDTVRVLRIVFAGRQKSTEEISGGAAGKAVA